MADIDFAVACFLATRARMICGGIDHGDAAQKHRKDQKDEENSPGLVHRSKLPEFLDEEHDLFEFFLFVGL